MELFSISSISFVLSFPFYIAKFLIFATFFNSQKNLSDQMFQSLGFSRALVGQRMVIRSKKLSHLKHEHENPRKRNGEKFKGISVTFK